MDKAKKYLDAYVAAKVGRVFAMNGVDDIPAHEAAELPEVASSHADRELRRFRALPTHAPDRHLVRTYLEWIVDLPWSVETEDHLELKAARETPAKDAKAAPCRRRH